MKKILALSFIIYSLSFSYAMAQDDDMYYRPVKKSDVKAATFTYYSGSDRDVDEYNRHGKYSNVYVDADSLLGTVLADSTVKVVNIYVNNNDDYACVRNMNRWYGTCWGDPWCWGWSWNWGWGPRWYDPWYDPWYYDPWYRPYGPGWYRPYDPWYRPWGPGPIIVGPVYRRSNPAGYNGDRSWAGMGRSTGGGSRSYSVYGNRGRVSNMSFGSRRSSSSSSSSSGRFGGNHNYSDGAASSRSLYSPSRSSSSESHSSGYSSGSFGGGHTGGGSGGGSFGGGGGHSGGGGGGFGGRH